MTSSVTNYFKTSSGDLFFFVDSVPESVESAFAAATSCAATLINSELSVYRPLALKGPWERCKIVGHRSYASIRYDLSTVTEREKREALEDELAALQVRYAQAAA